MSWGATKENKKALAVDGPENHRQLYALLSEGKFLFSSALRATTGTPSPQETEAGLAIFQATLNALQYFPTAEELPTIDEVRFDGSNNDAVLPLPVLATLGYFRNDVRSVCLTALHFKYLHTYDTAVLAYPNTILWGQPAITRHITDMAKVFSGESNRFPLLSYPRIRAYQLCRYGELILEHELERLGEPKIARIFLPGDGELH